MINSEVLKTIEKCPIFNKFAGAAAMQNIYSSEVMHREIIISFRSTKSGHRMHHGKSSETKDMQMFNSKKNQIQQLNPAI